MNTTSDVKVLPPVRALVVTGQGFNCEAESVQAWRLAGAAPTALHFNDLLARPAALLEHDVLMFIGGFSYGDHMGSGHVLATRVRHRLRGQIERFIDGGGLILGVCNGFQILARLGLVPGLDGEYFTPRVTLAMNDVGTFRNLWVTLRFEPRSPCLFTRGLDRMDLPVRHGEGKVFTLDRRLLDRLEEEGCIACRYADPLTGDPTMKYPHNPNGSLRAIAGLCDPTGRIFGLMPHPEAYLYPENHPAAVRQRMDGTLPARGLGLRLFENAAEAVRLVRAPARGGKAAGPV